MRAGARARCAGTWTSRSCSGRPALPRARSNRDHLVLLQPGHRGRHRRRHPRARTHHASAGRQRDRCRHRLRWLCRRGSCAARGPQFIGSKHSGERGEIAARDHRDVSDSVPVVVVGGALPARRSASLARARRIDTRHPRLWRAAPAYDRVRLSEILVSGASAQTLQLRPPEWFEDHRVDAITGRKVAAVRADERLVELDDGAVIPYATLVLATGPTRCCADPGPRPPARAPLPRSETATRSATRRARRATRR